MVLVPFSQEHRVSVIASLTKNLNGDLNIEVDFTLAALWCSKRQKQDSIITLNCSDLEPPNVIKKTVKMYFSTFVLTILKNSACCKG